MNSQVKLGLYVVTAIGTLLFGAMFLHAWRQAGPVPESKAAKVVVPAAKTAPPSTNHAGAGTNSIVSSNGVATAVEPTNAPVVAEAPPAESELPPEREPVGGATAGQVSGRNFASMLTWGLLALVMLGGLGTLAAYDISQYAGQKAGAILFDENAPAMGEGGDYEEIEKVYHAGDFLEAIRLLREYHKANPRALHAQIRIAEIYEKDLNNPLAAALEYEDVIQHLTEPERKGWTIIHLVNLYNRLDKPQQAIALMKKLVADHPNTPAAVKAMERLHAAGIEVDAPAPLPPPDEPSSGPPEPPSSLPRGFRPRG